MALPIWKDVAPRALPIRPIGTMAFRAHGCRETLPMLLVGIDWAEREHAACLLASSGQVLQRLKVAHSPDGLRRLQAAIATHAAERSAVVVAIERPDGLLVEALLAAGYTIYALNPKAVERYRGRTRTSGAKSDPADAELLARVLLTDRERHTPLLPSSPQAQEVRLVARQDERASRDQRRLVNRLRQDLLESFPQITSAFDDLGSVCALEFLVRWPSLEAARRLSLAQLTSFLRSHCHSRPDVAAARIQAALHAEALAVPSYRVRAISGGISLAVQQLLLLHRQRQAWRTRLAELLDGPGAHPDGEVLLSLPGLAVVLAARVLGEIGDRRERFATPAALQCYAGTAPVTRASGRLRVVTLRRSGNRQLQQAVLGWAYCSIPRSAWAKSVYEQQRAKGNSHAAALRVVANRWLEVLHHLLASQQRYDAAVHEHNRQRSRLPQVA
jgi:transposase